MSAPTIVAPTGVPGLDLILHGGLPTEALIFVVGMPGAGKTILASQLLFHALQRGQRGLILTTYSEGHVKLLDHLKTFSFFDEAQVGSTLLLYSLPAVIRADIEQAATSLVKIIRESAAGFVVIDGFQALVDHFDDPNALRRLLASLSIQLSYLKITLIITFTGEARDQATSPLLTTADLVLALDYSRDDWRHRRRLEVVKQRGRPHLSGAHSYSIGPDGLVIEPRLEVRPLGIAQVRPTGRAPFNLAELDNLMRGGLTAGSITLMVGAPGVGKTTLGLHWGLSGAATGTQTVFLSFEERPEELRSKAEVFGLPIAEALHAGTLTISYRTSVELTPIWLLRSCSRLSRPRLRGW